jgi:hypothetical protein
MSGAFYSDELSVVDITLLCQSRGASRQEPASDNAALSECWRLLLGEWWLFRTAKQAVAAAGCMAVKVWIIMVSRLLRYTT